MTPIKAFLLDLKEVLKKHNATIWATGEDCEEWEIELIVQLNNSCYKDTDQWLCKNAEELDGLSETSIDGLLAEFEVTE